MPRGHNEEEIAKLKNINTKHSAGSVVASLVEGVIKAAEAEGLVIQQALELLRLDKDVLNSATERIDLETFRALLNIISKLSQDEAIGIRIGQHLSISSFNALGHAAASSNSLWEALQLIPQFESIIMTVGKTEIIQEDGYVIVSWSMTNGAYLEILEDIFLSCWINLAKLLTGFSDLNIEVSLTCYEKKDITLWQEILGTSLLFDQSTAAIKFDESLLNLSVKKPDPFLRKVMTKEAEGLSLALDESLSAQIERWLSIQLEGGVPEQGILARYLNVSERTLRRNLKRENTSFRSLLRKVRIEKANYLLRKTSLSLWEVSSQLGYQQLTTFNAAYKRWTGNTPASQRK